MSSTKNIFAIYASQDKDVLKYLLLHLQPLEKDFNVAIWSDDAIKPGQPWKPRNVSRLDHADIFLLLLSNTFMYSEFIEQDEFKMVIDRYKEGKATVIPILLDDCPWDVEFTSDDYNFSFKELKVFPKDKKPIGDWNATDEAFKQVAYYVKGILNSSTKKNVLEEPLNIEGKKILSTKKEEQIAIDFFEEREAERERKLKKEAEAKKRIEEKNILQEEAKAKKIIQEQNILREEAEAKKRFEENNRRSEEAAAKEVIRKEAEAKEVVRKEKRLRQKAEIQKRIEKEKSLKEKAKNDKKIKEEAEAKRVVQKEKRAKEEAEAKKALEEKTREETAKASSEAEQEKRQEEVIAPQKRVIKNSRLAAYNYQFKTAKVANSISVIQEEKRHNEEVRAKQVVEEKRLAEIIKAERETEREEKLEKLITPQQIVTKKNGLAGYNYQFKTAKVVEAKSVVKEESRSNGEASAKMIVEVKRRVELTRSKIRTELENRLDAVSAVLKRTMKKIGSAARNYKFKTTTAINQFSEEAKNKLNTNKKIKVRYEFLIPALVVFGILIYVFTGDSENQSTTLSETEVAEVDSDAGANTETNPENQAAAILKLSVGDTYDGGIIFAIDPSNTTGKIAYFDDLGPMTWNEAMNIHEQLGERWRLPTLEELRLMYKNIGKGADNRGEFTDELYWSATPFDDYQARLVRFSDGDTSFHFNSAGTYREFRVRAIQDFKR